MVFKSKNTPIHSVKASRDFDTRYWLGDQVEPTHMGVFLEETKEAKD